MKLSDEIDFNKFFGEIKQKIIIWVSKFKKPEEEKKELKYSSFYTGDVVTTNLENKILKEQRLYEKTKLLINSGEWLGSRVHDPNYMITGYYSPPKYKKYKPKKKKRSGNDIYFNLDIS